RQEVSWLAGDLSPAKCASATRNGCGDAMNIPSWYTVVLLGLAAWRIFNLLAYDKILDWPRRKVLRIAKDWENEGDPVGDHYRLKWGLFLICLYCAGFWIGLLWWLAWLAWPHATLVTAVPFAVNGVIIALAKFLTPEDE